MREAHRALLDGPAARGIPPRLRRGQQYALSDHGTCSAAADITSTSAAPISSSKGKVVLPAYDRIHRFVAEGWSPDDGNIAPAASDCPGRIRQPTRISRRWCAPISETGGRSPSARGLGLRRAGRAAQHGGSRHCPRGLGSGSRRAASPNAGSIPDIWHCRSRRARGRDSSGSGLKLIPAAAGQASPTKR